MRQKYMQSMMYKVWHLIQEFYNVSQKYPWFSNKTPKTMLKFRRVKAFLSVRNNVSQALCSISVIAMVTWKLRTNYETVLTILKYLSNFYMIYLAVDASFLFQLTFSKMPTPFSEEGERRKMNECMNKETIYMYIHIYSHSFNKHI